MEFRFPTKALVIRSLAVALAFSVLATIVLARYIGQQQRPAGTETNSYSEKYDDKGRLVEKKEYDKNALRKRTTYTYLTGFKEPNTSTTTYGPDGQTPEKTTNVDHDKDGNPTITTTTDYDKDGKEIGGTKRERDPKTGKERCYKWDPKKQQYEEVPCPQETAQSASQPPAKPSPRVRVNITDRNTTNDTCTCGESKTPCPCPSPSPTPAPANSQNARVETGRGLQTVIFDTPPGLIRVYLPDDMRAGDTISGTVMAEPKGQTPEERAKNMEVLSGYVIEVETSKKPDGTSNPKVKAEVTAPIPQLRITLPPTPTPPLTNVSSGSSGGLGITLTNASGSFSTGGTITIPIELVSLSLQSVAPLNTFQLPTIGQPGRPAVINGPFQVNGGTTLMYGPPGASVQDFEKNTENVSGGFGLINPIAQSPRKCVFEAPTNVTGPIELYLKEGNIQTKGEYRNVRVNLTAPKTSLIKGESTELHVQVSGLQGIKEPVPLTLESHGVITMEGGMYQPLVIQPSEVGADGRYSTTRGITGVQTGVWGATATVVTNRFDVCLQDDSVPATVILVNTFSGNYIFAPPGGTSLSGNGTVTRKGCIINLTDSAPDRRVQGNFDPCTHTGSASVQTVSPKVKFTITDRNTTNNTCAVQ